MSSIFVKAEPYFFLAPALAILLVFLIFPLFWNIYISFHDVSLITILNEWEYVGWTNFIDLFNDPNFKFIFDDNFGILNYILNQLGLQSVGWLSDPNIVIWSLVIANVWYGTPFTILFLTAGLLSLNPTIYEAAVMDGATKLRSFRYITLPLLRPFIVINLVLITMWSVNFFDIQLVMTGGGPLFASTTASLYMYRQAFEFGLLSKGAVAGIILIIINLSVALIYLKLLRR
jgi:ABC-type sugar transport system permease subunit